MPTPLFNMSRSKNIGFFFLFLLLVLTASYYFVELRFSHTYMIYVARMDDLLQGTARRPWQCRVLVPWIVRGLSHFDLPLPVFDTVGMRRFVDHQRLLWTPAVNLFALIEILSTFCLVIVFRYYLSFFFRKLKTNIILSFSIFYPLVFTFILPDRLNIWYPYDIPLVLLFTLGLIFLYKRQWFFYYPLFIAATLNRETACFLTFVYLFTAWGKDRLRTIMLHCVSQFVIWCIIIISLQWLYRDNPGRDTICQFHENFRLLTGRAYAFGPYPLMLSILGYIWIPVLLLQNRIGNLFVRRSLLVTIPFLAAILYGCNIHEVRDYGELIPIYLTALLLIIKNLIIDDFCPATKITKTPRYRGISSLQKEPETGVRGENSDSGRG